MKIGILALQGGYSAHARALTELDVPWCYIRTPAELQTVNGIILPGGESSTALKLLQQNDLFTALQQCGQQGMPMFGTCAGAILLAKRVLLPTQPSLGLVDVTIERNAYGRQLASCIVEGFSHLTSQPMPMCFIRAPRFSELPAHITVLADYQGEPVCVQQQQYILATFHPELTADNQLHRHFIELVASAATNGNK